MASAEADRTGKQFDAPASGNAALYVYRLRSGNPATISVGRDTLGTLQGRTWLRVDLPAGRYDVRCTQSTVGTEKNLLVDLHPNTTTFLSVTERFTPTWGCYPVEEAADPAKSGIMGSRRIREVGNTAD